VFDKNLAQRIPDVPPSPSHNPSLPTAPLSFRQAADRRGPSPSLPEPDSVPFPRIHCPFLTTPASPQVTRIQDDHSVTCLWSTVCRSFLTELTRLSHKSLFDDLQLFGTSFSFRFLPLVAVFSYLIPLACFQSESPTPRSCLNTSFLLSCGLVFFPCTTFSDPCPVRFRPLRASRLVLARISTLFPFYPLLSPRPFPSRR